MTSLRVPALLHTLVVALVVVGCSSDDRSPVEVMREGLAHALPDEALGPSPAVEGPLAEDPLLRDPAYAALPIAPFEIVSNTTWRMDVEGGRTLTVEDEVRFTQRADGAFRSALTRRSSDPPSPDRKAGSEAVYVDRRFFVRDLYGAFVEHNAMRELHVPWRRRALDTLPALVRLLGPSLAKTPGEPTSRDGAVLQRTNLALAAGRPAAPSSDVGQLRDDLGTWDEWWRAVNRPVSLRGEALTDARCGCIVGARIDASFEGRAGERPFTLRIDHRFTLTRLTIEPPITVPPDASEPRRRRVEHMIREVLGDLSPLAPVEDAE